MIKIKERMKPHLIILRIVMLLFIVSSFSTTAISQDTTYTQFIEAGGGMGYSESVHGAFNGGLTFFSSISYQYC
jgi:hypothetical protein